MPNLARNTPNAHTGKYKVEMYESFLRLHGKTYDYKIMYKSISKMFLLPKPDMRHTFFVISLDDPIRQGQQRYPHLVMHLEMRGEEINLSKSAPPRALSLYVTAAPYL